ncbi:O-antigen ligase domain-containing protein [Sphingomonas koreensis]|nr:O-antigen ligase domain-containing protein [Sphingomonas koreensis]
MVLGGGGSPAPLPELLVELFALLALGIWLLAPSIPGRNNPPDFPLWVGIAAFVSIPLIQLVPLPPALWHALPGRDGEIAALNIIGQADSWRPISLSPYMTLASMLSLIPSIVILFVVSRLSLVERAQVLGAISIIGLTAGLVGMLQVASGNGQWFLLYAHQSPGFATGFQANRNAGADVFLITIIAVASYCATRRSLIKDALGKLLLAATVVFLILITVLTGSRAGTTLIPFAIGPGIFALLTGKRIGRGLFAGTGIVVIVVLGLTAATWNNAQIDRTWTRFSRQSEARPDLWRDTIFAIGQTAPVGSGLGTFAPVMTAVERLEVVDTTMPNRAHDDYLEFCLETGLVGIVTLLGILLALSLRAYCVLRTTRSNRQRVQVIAGLGFLGILGLHSIVDYPMRSMAVAGLAAIGIGMLSRVAVGRGEDRESV